MAQSDEMKVAVERLDDAVVVRPCGDIDLSRSPTLRRHLAEVQSGSPPRVIVDLVDVPYMDSSGVATLVEAMQVARRSSSRLVLCGMQQRVRSIFEIARLDMVFKIVPGVDEALLA